MLLQVLIVMLHLIICKTFIFEDIKKFHVVPQCSTILYNVSHRSIMKCHISGLWSSKAAQEAKKYGKVNLVIPKPDKYTSIASQESWKLDPNASYVHICFNETVHGKLQYLFVNKYLHIKAAIFVHKYMFCVNFY